MNTLVVSAMENYVIAIFSLENFTSVMSVLKYNLNKSFRELEETRTIDDGYINIKK